MTIFFTTFTIVILTILIYTFIGVLITLRIAAKREDVNLHLIWCWLPILLLNYYKGVRKFDVRSSLV